MIKELTTCVIVEGGLVGVRNKKFKSNWELLFKYDINITLLPLSCFSHHGRRWVFVVVIMSGKIA